MFSRVPRSPSDIISMEPTCINLEERFGKQYRICWEADGVTKAQWPKEDWPWLMELRCKYGLVYPWGGEILQAMSPHPRIGAQLRRLPFVLHAQGDEETVVRFHIDHIEQVFRLLKPYRRRNLAAAELERLKRIGARTRLGPTRGVQSEHTGLQAPNGPGSIGRVGRRQ